MLGRILGDQDIFGGKLFHLIESDGLTMSTLEQRGPLAWDWQKGVFVLVLALFAVGTVVFLLNLFIF